MYKHPILWATWSWLAVSSTGLHLHSIIRQMSDVSLLHFTGTASEYPFGLAMFSEYVFGGVVRLLFTGSYFLLCFCPHIRVYGHTQWYENVLLFIFYYKSRHGTALTSMDGQCMRHQHRVLDWTPAQPFHVEIQNTNCLDATVVPREDLLKWVGLTYTCSVIGQNTGQSQNSHPFH